jgi:hypothetical protein
MITTIILVSAALVTLLVLLRLAQKRALAFRWLQAPATYLRSVDLEAFRNLIDPSEEQFLRAHLPPAEFRRIQRQRLRATVQYVSAVAHNAKVLLRLGQAARLSSDPSIAAAAENLVETALQLRFTAFRSLALLYWRIILPGRHASLAPVAEGYEQITGQVVMLGLRYPLRGVSEGL